MKMHRSNLSHYVFPRTGIIVLRVYLYVCDFFFTHVRLGVLEANLHSLLNNLGAGVCVCTLSSGRVCDCVKHSLRVSDKGVCVK